MTELDESLEAAPVDGRTLYFTYLFMPSMAWCLDVTVNNFSEEFLVEVCVYIYRLLLTNNRIVLSAFFFFFFISE